MIAHDVYIGETGRTLGQRFGKHLRSMPGFPVAKHFNPNGHTIPRRKSPSNYALRWKQATKASGDAPYFQTRHQSAAQTVHFSSALGPETEE